MPRKLLSILFLHFFVVSSMGEKISLVEQKLLKIIQLEENFFANVNEVEEHFIASQAQELVHLYENIIENNPDHVESKILFGKFLIKVGQHEDAIPLFLEADQLNPNLAVTKQQIANHLIHTNRAVDALPFMLMATEIEPEHPIYHFSLGQFLQKFKTSLLDANISNLPALDDLMLSSFNKASELEPGNFNYALRFAQCFHDLDRSNKLHALDAWNRLNTLFTHLTPREKQYVNLQRAHFLIDLNRTAEAQEILESIENTSLLEAKGRLNERISNKNH
jgi:tetratricopeptide (TPR) repeat protein